MADKTPITEGVTLEPKDTPMGEFQKERTDAISEMFDGADENGIYPTTKFFVRLDNCVRQLLKAQSEKGGRMERERIADYLRDKYGDVGVGQSRTAVYSIAKDLCLDLVLRQVLKEGK